MFTYVFDFIVSNNKNGNCIYKEKYLVLVLDTNIKMNITRMVSISNTIKR